jgi:D-2-hydroxyglutarate dehydrogenase
MMPLDLGAKGSCQIGGNVSTNAGGLRLVRYGSLHGSVLGLEVVLADGRVLDLLSVLRKDNTGYDLKQLFIGAEGTLGVVTKVALLTPRRPTSTQVAYLACASYAHVLQTLMCARTVLGELLSAIEFQDRRSLELVLQHTPGTRDPFAGSVHPFYVLVESAGSDAAHDAATMARFVERALTEELVCDGTVARDASQQRALWRLRESVAASAGKHGSVYKYDCSLPTHRMYNLVLQMQQRMQDRAVCVGYGHVGDGNIHVNVIAPTYDAHTEALIEPYVFECVSAEGGSISAEHGIGQGKVPFLHYSKSATAISMMQSIKHTFDPHGILNPYKTIPL